MKKIMILGMAALVMLATACKKNEQTDTSSFSASIETDNSRTHLDGMKVKWYVGDVIRVYGEQGDQKDYTCTGFISGSEDQRANFSCGTAGVKEGSTYWSFYPSTACTSLSGNTFTFTMPATQTYTTGNTFANTLNPMAAISNNTVLPFKNAFGILQINATGNSPITSIELTDNSHALYGTFTFDRNALTTAAANNGINHTLIMSCSGITLNSTARAFYFILPPGCLGNGFTVTFKNGSNVVKTMSCGAHAENVLARNTIKTAALDASVVYAFSVSSSKRVVFAPGNLKSNNDGGGWSFQANQWDASIISPRGLFYFSNNLSGNNYGIDYQGEGSSFVDWGDIFSEQDWFTLSYEEWYYLLYQRTNASNLRRVYTSVNGVRGLVLMPDGWNGSISEYYSGSGWTNMENQGAVFLPRTSSCVHWANPIWPYIHGMTNFIGEEWYNSPAGYYWASTGPGSDIYAVLYFSANSNDELVLEPTGGQGYARAVRLVKEVH